MVIFTKDSNCWRRSRLYKLLKIAYVKAGAIFKESKIDGTRVFESV